MHPGPDQAKEPEGLCKVVRQLLSGLRCRGEGAPGGAGQPLGESPHLSHMSGYLSCGPPSRTPSSHHYLLWAAGQTLRVSEANVTSSETPAQRQQLVGLTPKLSAQENVNTPGWTRECREDPLSPLGRDRPRGAHRGGRCRSTGRKELLLDSRPITPSGQPAQTSSW